MFGKNRFRDPDEIRADREENLQIARYRFGTRRDQATERIIRRALEEMEETDHVS